MSSLYILDIIPLSEIWFANIFSPSISSLFILLMVSLLGRSIFHLMWLHLFLFAFFPVLLVSYPLPPPARKKHGQETFHLCSLLGVLQFYDFRSLIPFELIFAHGVRKCPISIFCMWTFSFINTIY